MPRKTGRSPRLNLSTPSAVNDSANGSSRALYLGDTATYMYPGKAQQTWNCLADWEKPYASSLFGRKETKSDPDDIAVKNKERR
jgi:hypothetical protein